MLLTGKIKNVIGKNQISTRVGPFKEGDLHTEAKVLLNEWTLFLIAKYLTYPLNAN